MDALGWITTILTVMGGIVGLAMTGRGYYLSRRTLRVFVKEQVRSVRETAGVLRRQVAREEQVLTLTAHNRGTQSVPIASAQLLVGDERVDLDNITEGHFPLDLGGGKSYHLPLRRTTLHSALIDEGLGGEVQVRAIFRDGLGKEYRSKPSILQL